MQTLEKVTVRVKVLTPADSVGKAAEAVRNSTVGAVPVVESGWIAGLVTAEVLAEYLSAGSPEWLKERRVAELPLERAVALPERLSPQEALHYLRENGLERAPVVDAANGLAGMVSTAELVSAVCGRVRPPLIGGMATPFGVYLTGGGARGGVGDWALVSTGAYLALMNLVAAGLAEWLVGKQGALAGALAAVPFAANGEAAGWLTFLLFALMFRLSWITGYHAAEHQVVHTIEAGDDLRPEVVRAKPRVHPRCGTNLVAAVLIAGFFWEHFHAGSYGLLLAIVATLFLWRRVGGFFQQYVTTRPASPGQLESGILAGEQLMERFQQQPRVPLTVARRIWNMGLLQVLAGWAFVFGLYWLASLLLPIPEALRLTL
jgi:CBS domain-containing protein